MEWFNLASIHGPHPHLIHDDFYDENGRACQPTTAVASASRFPMPSVADFEGNTDRLLDFATTRHFLWEQCQPELIAALRRVQPSTLLERLKSRVATMKNPHVEYVCLVVCGHAVGPLAAPWVEERYAAIAQPVLLGALAFAGSRCLSEDRAFELASRALEQVTIDLPTVALASLGWLRSERSLDWIERMIRPPLVDTWGRLAAVSRPRWGRLARWLDAGRPLSLVALDTLIEIGTGRALNYQAGAPMVRWLEPVLIDPPGRAEAVTTIESYAATDDVPRVRRAVEAIARNWGLVAEGAMMEWVRD